MHKRILLEKVHKYLFCNEPFKSKEQDEEKYLAEFAKTLGDPREFFAIAKYIKPENRPQHVKFNQDYNQSVVNTEVEKGFVDANSKYKYFSIYDKKALEIYEACYLVTQYAYRILGAKKVSDIGFSEAERGKDFLAYKMLVLFGREDISSTLSNFDKVANATCSTQIVQTRDLLEIEIPTCQDYAKVKYSLDQARYAVANTKLTKAVLNSFTTLPKIYSKYKEIKTDPIGFKDQLIGIKIPNCKKNPKLAKLCYKYGQIESFDAIMKSMDIGLIKKADNGIDIAKKDQDDMPDLHVEYTNAGTGSKYHFVKLPESNLRALLLGAITGNCQSYGNSTRFEDNYILDCLKRPNSAFYVLVKEGKKGAFTIDDLDNLEDSGYEIIGQTPAWLGENKTFSFEALHLVRDRSSNIDLKALLQSIGKALKGSAAEIDRFTVADYAPGMSEAKNTYQFWGADINYTVYSSVKLEGAPYEWGIKQIEAYRSDALRDARKELADLTQIRPQIHITSVAQANAVKCLWKKLEGGDKDYLKENYINITNCFLLKDWNIGGDNILEDIFKKIKDLGEQEPNKFKKIFCDPNGFNGKFPLYNLYKFGVKIEQLLDLSEEAIDFMFSELMISTRDSPLMIGINIPRLFDKIKSAKSVSDIKKLILKAVATDKCKEDNVDYIDSLPEKSLDNLLNAPQIVDYAFTDIKTLSEMDEDIFEFITNSTSFGHMFSYYYSRGIEGAKSLSEILKSFTSLDDITKYALKSYILMSSHYSSTLNSEGDEFVDSLSPELICGIVNSPYKTGIGLAENVRDIVPSNNISGIQLERNLITSMAKHINSDRAAYQINELSDDELRSVFLEREVVLDLLCDTKALELYEGTGIKILHLANIPPDDLRNFLHNNTSSLTVESILSGNVVSDVSIAVDGVDEAASVPVIGGVED